MTRGRVRVGAALVGVGVMIALAACSGWGGAPGTATRSGTVPAFGGTITVFAAASLTATFTELADEFESAHPGTTVELSFAGSSDLVTQITEGAPADVFASADESTMLKLVDAGLIEKASTVDLATNVLQIAVPPSNPAGVARLADLADPGVATVLCAPQVPCGAAAVAVQKATGVDIRPVSEELSVTDVLGKITSGEADAGLVYVTDVLAAGDAVDGIAFPESSEARNTCPIAVVEGSANRDAAQAFVDFVAGTVGRQVLDAAGFGTPESGR
ncbi:molybdate transport system substrate-binding protein [Mycetocola sp. CAN_C7]|uniref:molybdate ABC transporter substrate-binding protein n=1 Tax=Mycetocola sp. CAN_C7 TaxID=2787724 RepID=UPI0018CAAB1A